MLDKQSEKVLKIAISNYDGDTHKIIPIPPEDIGVYYSELNSLCSYLQEQGYISNFQSSTNPKFSVYFQLTHKGLHYFEQKKSTNKQFIKNSVIVPISVTLLTNIIISLSKWLLPLILQLLHGTP